MEYGILSHYIYILLLILILLIIGCYVIKKECFESKSVDTQGQKYTVSEISKSVDTLLSSLNDRHSLVKVHSVHKSSPYLSFECMLYNHDHPSVKIFSAKVKIPLSSKGMYTLENATVSDSNEVIENGTHGLRDSQVYGNLKQKFHY